MKNMKKTLAIISICLAFLVASFSVVFAVDNNTEEDIIVKNDNLPVISTSFSTEPENYNVYYSLKNVTSTNTKEKTNSHYFAIIKPYDGYVIDYFVVTVNNQQIMIPKESNGSYVVSLDGVDGDIQIIASATSNKPTEPESTTYSVGFDVYYNLSNVTSSNNTADAWMNYRTTLTPKPGYAITYVSVTIDGKDVGTIKKENGEYKIFVEYIRGDLTITAEAKRVLTETPQELQSLYPKTNFTVANLGKVGRYNLYYNVTDYYQFGDYDLRIGDYVFNCFAQQSPSDLGLYIVGDGKAYTLKDAYSKLNINMDTVYSLINKNNLRYNFTVSKNPVAKLSSTNIILKSGATKTIKAVAGTVRSWTISNKKVAIVNKGKITALNKGTATITATLTTGEKLTCKVTVTTSPSLTSTNISLKSGTSKTIKTVGGTVKSWTTSNNKVATVNNGKVTALNKGSATITATLTTGKKLTCKVVVSTAPKLSKATVKVKKGGTATVKVSGKVATINNKYTNTKVAKITSKTNATTLKIKGLKKGTTSLKIKVNGVKTLNLKVNVK